MRTTAFWGRGPSRTRSRRRDQTIDAPRCAPKGISGASGTARIGRNGKRARPRRWPGRGTTPGARGPAGSRSRTPRAPAMDERGEERDGNANTSAGPRRRSRRLRRGGSGIAPACWSAADGRRSRGSRGSSGHRGEHGGDERAGERGQVAATVQVKEAVAAATPAPKGANGSRSRSGRTSRVPIRGPGRSGIRELARAEAPDPGELGPRPGKAPARGTGPARRRSRDLDLPGAVLGFEDRRRRRTRASRRRLFLPATDPVRRVTPGGTSRALRGCRRTAGFSRRSFDGREV
jgi:hypothetical protein